MIRLSLAELRAVVGDDAKLSAFLRQIHLGTWADALDKQIKVVVGD